MTLDQLPIGTNAWITTVGGEGALRLRLLDMGLIPKTKVTVIKTATVEKQRCLISLQAPISMSGIFRE